MLHPFEGRTGNGTNYSLEFYKDIGQRRMIKASEFLRGRVLLDATESRYEDLS